MFPVVNWGHVGSLNDIITDDGGFNSDSAGVLSQALPLGNALAGNGVSGGGGTLDAGTLAQISMINAASASRGGGGPGM